MKQDGVSERGICLACIHSVQSVLKDVVYMVRIVLLEADGLEQLGQEYTDNVNVSSYDLGTVGANYELR